jgi:hypothetical protein
MKTLELRQHTIKPLLRALLRPILSPRMFQLLRFRWWFLSSYFPRLLSSRLVRRTAQVCGFGAALIPSNLAKQLQSVNVLAPTKVCRVMTKCGSDKGRSNNYTPLYSTLFKERYHQPLRIFELGLGTNNRDVSSNMGVFGVPGASLRGSKRSIQSSTRHMSSHLWSWRTADTTTFAKGAGSVKDMGSLY